MVTPYLVQALFWIGCAACAIVGLRAIIIGASGDESDGGALVLVGVVVIVLGPVMVRVYCELLILLFRIYDRLGEIRDGARAQGSS
jgi:hypothetical protein